MGSEGFHERPYDGGTIRKLEIFELYAQEWLPVFLAPAKPWVSEVHVFDFFCGPGADSLNIAGSPLRFLNQLRLYHTKNLAGWTQLRIVAHFFDQDEGKVERLRATLATDSWTIPGVETDVRRVQFHDALQEYQSTLQNPKAAKLLIIDQFGVDAVSDSVFLQLIDYPTCDFIFFLSSSTLHRFRDHPAIKQKIRKPEDSCHVHRAAFEHFLALIPADRPYYLAPFSIKKRSNIYGLIFGSRHPLGIHKFLEVAWANDAIAGEADFDIDRENIAPGELLLGLDEMKPRKLRGFHDDLRNAIKSGALQNEAEIARFCLQAGMTCQKARTVLQELITEGVIRCAFRVPNIRELDNPRPVELVKRS
jgi:three-Cys-motif partner protein